MKNLLLVILAAGLVVLPGRVHAQEDLLKEMLSTPEFWAMSPDVFMEKYGKLGFEWTSATKQGARADGKRVRITMFGRPVGETLVGFAQEKPSQVQVSIHNRGDNGEIAEQAFFDAIDEWKTSVTEIAAVPAVERGKDNSSAARAEGFQWNGNGVAYLLEYSAQREIKSRSIPFRSEFIRLRAAPVVKRSFMEEKLAKETRVLRSDLPANVIRKDGDTFIQGVPMVDQGEKGYCVVASTARVFGYYGMQVDQHEIAQIANSDANEGTSTEAMIEALKDIAGRFKVRVKVHDDMDYSAMQALTSDYNRVAKRQGKLEMPSSDTTNQWYNFESFDPAILKETRLKSAAGIKKFKAEVERTITEGVPLLWTVTVGIYPEERINPQTRGGHMRMIIGYNWEKNQLIYTDSWGAGHELKRWGVEEAYCSTKGLYSIQPIK